MDLSFPSIKLKLQVLASPTNYLDSKLCCDHIIVSNPKQPSCKKTVRRHCEKRCEIQSGGQN